MSMEYKRLPFNQYYIEMSNDHWDTGKIRIKRNYNHTEFDYKIFGFIKVHCVADWEVCYDKERDVIQCFFQQTNGKADWIINLLFKEKLYDKFTYSYKGKKRRIQLKAARGWSKMYKVIKHDVKEQVANLLIEHPDANIEILGWSLGSGLAQLATQDIDYHFTKKPYVYTTGSVKPWRGFRTRKYLRTTYEECYNFMHRSDIVTYMPPFIGYFALRPVKLGKFSIKEIFNPGKWHCEYGEEYLYKGM